MTDDATPETRGRIDWRRHIGRVRELLDELEKAPDETHGSPLARRTLSDYGLETVAKLLASRHIPAWAKARHPGVPWKAIADFAQQQRAGHYGIELRPRASDLALSFARLHAARVAEATIALEEELVMTNADQDDDPFLAVEGGAGFVEVTVRVPSAAADRVADMVRAAYAEAGLAAPTVDEVRAKLASASAALAEKGVSSLLVFGSVARGEAKPWSDVDLAYRVDPPSADAWGLWTELHELIEGALGRRIDLHDAEELSEWAGKRALEVWRRADAPGG